jgi:hypothetical protein
MNKYNFKLRFLENIVINNTEIDLIWTNALIHNVILDQHKHTKQTINPYILFSNYLIMFPNWYYHTK